MNKSELVTKIHQDIKVRGMSKSKIEIMLHQVFDALAKGIIKDGKFTYPKFGSLVLRKRKPRSARNPQTGQTIEIQSRKTIVFKPSLELKKNLK